MSPTPRSEGKARAIRELSRELSHSPRTIPSPSEAEHESNPTLGPAGFVTGSSFDIRSDNEDFLASTRQFDEETTNPLPSRPYIRSTAKKVGAWTMPQSDLPVDTSVVNQHFNDFDGSGTDDESESIEQARAANRSNRSTPNKFRSSFVDFDSLYDITPPAGRPRKANMAERGNLRRDAQIRRASQKDVGTPSKPTSARNSPMAASNRKRTAAATLAEDESFMSERPPTTTVRASSSRFRQASPQYDGTSTTPQRNAHGMPRPMSAANGTAQSFMLPDLPNLTELVSGVFQDGTPVFSKTAPPRPRHTAPNGTDRGGNRQPNHIPVDSVPIPEEERAIFASLNLLKEKVAQLEQERAEQEKAIEERDLEIIELKAATHAQENLRRSDSALGPSDGEGSGEQQGWKVEKTRLEASVETLRTRLDRAERKLSVSEIANKRITAERDNLVSQLSVAFYNSEALKTEKEALRTENDHLRQEVDTLRAENEDLHNQLQHEREQFQEETVQLRRNLNRADTAVQQENQTLRAELARARAQNDEQTQNLTRKETELRKARQEQAEFAQLKKENDALQAQLASLKARREAEARRWASRESDLKDRIGRRDETIRQFQDMTQEQTNEAIRLDNANLRAELAQLTAQHEEDNLQWEEKEARLRRKIERREGAVRQMEDMTREVLTLRQANGQRPTASRSGAAGQENDASKVTSTRPRRPSQPRDDTRARIATRVQEEVRNSRSFVNTAQTPTQPQLSPQKTRSRFQTHSQRNLPTNLTRTSSAPVPGYNDRDSDVESTTDLSLAPRTNTRPTQSIPTRKGATVDPPPALDITELSFVDTGAIADLRRQIEEERIRARQQSQAQAEAPTREDTVRSEFREDTGRSVASARSGRPQLPRKSSMKDMTEKTQGTVFEDLTESAIDPTQDGVEPTRTQPTVDHSVISNSARRRRSAPVEMTSAFIIPDLTLKFTNAEPSQKLELGQHDNKNCTVCRRQNAQASAEPVSVPRLVPVSDRMPDDVDATMRPSRSPKEALALVVKELKDEYSHLKLDWAAHNVLLEAHDASLGRRKRLEIEKTIEELLKRMHIKADQIYHLYDVLEGQGEHEITEQDVEELTREIRMDREPTRGKGKKVTLDLGGDRDQFELRSIREV